MPKVIVTDRDTALMNVVGTVFLETVFPEIIYVKIDKSVVHI